MADHSYKRDQSVSDIVISAVTTVPMSDPNLVADELEDEHALRAFTVVEDKTLETKSSPKIRLSVAYSEDVAKEKNYEKRYRRAWESDKLFQSWIAPVAEDDCYAFCIICKSTIVARKGHLLQHLKSSKHLQNCELQKSGQPPVARVNRNNAIIAYKSGATTRIVRRGEDGNERVYYEQCYRQVWESEKMFKDWVGPVSNDARHAYCRICQCGIRARRSRLILHARSNKHKQNVMTFESMGVSSVDPEALEVNNEPVEEEEEKRFQVFDDVINTEDQQQQNSAEDSVVVPPPSPPPPPPPVFKRKFRPRDELLELEKERRIAEINYLKMQEEAEKAKKAYYEAATVKAQLEISVLLRNNEGLQPTVIADANDVFIAD